MPAGDDRWEEGPAILGFLVGSTHFMIDALAWRTSAPNISSKRSASLPSAGPRSSTPTRGRKPPWTTEAEDFVLMRYTLKEAASVAEPRGIMIGLEPHQQYSKHPAGLERIFRLVDSPALGINFDTGNAYLCGHDPHVWLESVVEQLVHLHAKDISEGPCRPAARQGDWHAGGLRLRRRRHRLATGHRPLPEGTARHRAECGVRDSGSGPAEPALPSILARIEP